MNNFNSTLGLISTFYMCVKMKFIKKIIMKDNQRKILKLELQKKQFVFK